MFNCPHAAPREVTSACDDFIYPSSHFGSSPGIVCRLDPRVGVVRCVIAPLEAEFIGLHTWAAPFQRRVLKQQSLGLWEHNSGLHSAETRTSWTFPKVVSEVLMSAADCFTLIELFLQVVLVRLVAADPVQTLRRQTCKQTRSGWSETSWFKHLTKTRQS